MDKNKQIEEFINWLPTSGIEEFKGKTPQECSDMLQEALNFKDGEKVVEQLFNAYKQSKNKGTASSKADYLNSLKAQRGLKVGDKAGRIRHDTTWGIVKDVTDPETKKRSKYIENRYGDQILLTTGPHGDSTIQALPVMYYDPERKGTGYNPNVLDYETPEYRNAAAWTTRDGLTKFLDTMFGSWRWKPEAWEKARNLYGPYLKKAK